MNDEFELFSQTPATPSEHAFAVTPDDVSALPSVVKYLYVGTGGDVTLRTRDSDADVVFRNVPSGGYVFARASHVRATGTTATDIIGCA